MTLISSLPGGGFEIALILYIDVTVVFLFFAENGCSLRFGLSQDNPGGLRNWLDFATYRMQQEKEY
jgi:hypothetical protein